MFRKIVSTLALGMVLVAPAAHADPPYQSDFWFNNTSGSATAYDHYTGSFDNAEFFQVFCVNPVYTVTDPDHFAVWVTHFNQGDGSHAMNPNGNVWLGNYFHAAQLASLMYGNATSNFYTQSEVTSLQQAIWRAMGFNEGSVANLAFWDAEYAANGFPISSNQWFVITDDIAGNKQEFIYFDPDRPFETVPEPATMTLLATGLAGMAAARRRRNKA